MNVQEQHQLMHSKNGGKTRRRNARAAGKTYKLHYDVSFYFTPSTGFDDSYIRIVYSKTLFWLRWYSPWPQLICVFGNINCLSFCFMYMVQNNDKRHCWAADLQQQKGSRHNKRESDGSVVLADDDDISYKQSALYRVREE